MVGSISCVLHSFGIIINRFLFNIPLQAKIPIEWDFKGVKKSRKFKGFKSVKLCNFDPFPDINLDFDNFVILESWNNHVTTFKESTQRLSYTKSYVLACLITFRWGILWTNMENQFWQQSLVPKPRECRTIALKSNLINHKFYIKGFSSAHFVARIWNFIWVENPKNCLI